MLSGIASAVLLAFASKAMRAKLLSFCGAYPKAKLEAILDRVRQAQDSSVTTSRQVDQVDQRINRETDPQQKALLVKQNNDLALAYGYTEGFTRLAIDQLISQFLTRVYQ